jgi:GDPmannose 4,6-dehydratase
MSKVAFITGVTGQDGSYLLELLLHKGYIVHGLTRRSSNVIYEHYHEHIGDITDSDTIDVLLTKIWETVKHTNNIFEIYNLAAQSHVAKSFESPNQTAMINGMAPLFILEWIKSQPQHDRKQIRYFQASTSELFGKTDISSQNENTPFYPCSPYATAKLYAYWSVRNYREIYGIYAVNGILFNHESPRRNEQFVSRKITRAIREINVGKMNSFEIGNLDARRDWGHARDYVEGMWLMLQAEKPEDFVLGTGEQHSVREFIELAWHITFNSHIRWEGCGLEEKGYDVNGIVRVIVSAQWFRPTESYNLVGDSCKANKILGWKPKVSFYNLVKEMMDADLH